MWGDNKLKGKYGGATKVAKIKARECCARKYHCWPTGGRGSSSDRHS